MGIPSYFSYIIKNHKNIIKRLAGSQIPFQHLYMDCNSIIYDVIHKLEKNNVSINETEIFENICNKIEEYIFMIKPSNTIFIAFDGVAPFAKMEQQRTRRYKNWYLNKILNKESSWNTSQITPGTDFMNRLMERLKILFNLNKHKYNVPVFIFSGSQDHGEGEHKLFEHMRKNNSKNDNVIIYGLDSDLIMLSIFHRELFKNVYIFREAPEFIKSYVPIPIDSDSKLKTDEPYLMDIHYFMLSILDEMKCKDYDYHRIYDYVFLCFFLGNDFLPHFPSLNIRTNGIMTLLTYYRNHIGSRRDCFLISREKNIQWNNLYIIIQNICKNEHELIMNEYFVRDKWDKRRWDEKIELEEAILNLPIMDRSTEKYINPNEPGWQSRYYKILFKDDYNKPDFINNLCRNYLEGLEWVFKYYYEGCPDWRWKYNYNYPPLFNNLVSFVPRKQFKLIKNNRKPFKNNTQLAYVFSYESKENIQKLLNNTNIKTINNSNSIDFQWAFCRYFWESHVDFPEISIEKLIELDNVY